MSEYIASWADAGITLPPGAAGQITLLCPRCSHARSAEGKSKRCLSVNVEDHTWNCHHCNWSGRLTNGKAHINLTDLGADKQIPAASLVGFGLYDLDDGVAIPYFNADDSVYRIRMRSALRAKDGSSWLAGKGQIAYGVDRLKDAREVGFLVLVEGESDCWTLWLHDYPALGIPGAMCAKVLQAEHLGGIARLYAVQETDEAGAKFIDGIRQRLKALKYSGEFRVLHLGAKDANELHKRNPDGFRAAFDAALKEAEKPDAEKVGAPRSGPSLEDSSTPPPNGEPQAAPALVVIGIHEFLARELPQREKILSPWMLTQSLSMIYSWRGVGKTHVALGIAYAVATGGEFLGWKAERPRKVLFVDGEMPAHALQERLAAIVAASDREPEPGMLRLITPDLQPSVMLDLATGDGQTLLNSVIDDAELVILDNLSCLVRRGGRENEAESWLDVAEWALAHRAAGRSISFMHHAGKAGQQRGTSKREDLLDTVICLKRPPDYCPADGAVFEIHYEKARSLYGDGTAPIEAKLTTDKQGLQTWTIRLVTESTFDRVVELANEGLKQAEIAQELDINRSTVSRAWRKAEAEGLIIRKQGKSAKVVPIRARKDTDE